MKRRANVARTTQKKYEKYTRLERKNCILSSREKNRKKIGLAEIFAFLVNALRMQNRTPTHVRDRTINSLFGKRRIGNVIEERKIKPKRSVTKRISPFSQTAV